MNHHSFGHSVERDSDSDGVWKGPRIVRIVDRGPIKVKSAPVIKQPTRVTRGA